LRSVSRSGYGQALFAGWRYRDAGAGSLDPDFPLNQPRYQGAEILLCRRNFGCGSSREQAPWALRDSGIRALVGPSFGGIFYDNCLKNGLLPVVLPEPAVDRLFTAVAGTPGYRLTIDLPAQTVTTADGERLSFEIHPFSKRCLVQGLDDLAYALAHADTIRAFEAARRAEAPWIFADPRDP
jgi:3-isopropylmalate/(R)-2-methylmalate dehydratase small subunit